MQRLEVGFDAKQQRADLPVVAAFDAGGEAERFDGLRASRRDRRRLGRVHITAADSRNLQIVLPERCAGGDAAIEARPVVRRGAGLCGLFGVRGTDNKKSRSSGSQNSLLLHAPPPKQAQSPYGARLAEQVRHVNR